MEGGRDDRGPRQHRGGAGPDGSAGEHRLPLYAVKAALLLVATLVFAHVSWRLWPRRLFALAEERRALLARFRRAAYTLVVLVGAAFVLGVAAAQPH